MRQMRNTNGSSVSFPNKLNSQTGASNICWHCRILPPSYVLSIGDVLYPGGVAVDAAGNIYVSDTHRNCIKKFTGQGVAVTEVGRQRGGSWIVQLSPGSCHRQQQ